MPSEIENPYSAFVVCILALWVVVHLVAAVWPRALVAFGARDPFMLIGAWRMFSIQHRDQAGWIELQELDDLSNDWKTIRTSRLDWRPGRMIWAPDAYAAQQIFRQGMLLHARLFRQGRSIEELAQRQSCSFFRRLASISGTKPGVDVRVVLISPGQSGNESRAISLYRFPAGLS